MIGDRGFCEPLIPGKIAEIDNAIGMLAFLAENTERKEIPYLTAASPLLREYRTFVVAQEAEHTVDCLRKLREACDLALKIFMETDVIGKF